ncbi:MAG: 2-oxoglutarate dehydrogenase, partial [Chlamydiae bacterium]|nr:2-oxoglutarate dehydrogenase [Chlamydiota bacterium]
MKIEIKVPSVGESVTEVTVAKILKENGASLQKNEDILELETDKVNQVIAAPEAGLWTLAVKEQDRLPIGALLGYIDTDQAQKPPPPKPAKETKKEPPKPQEVSTTPGIRKFQEDYLNEPSTSSSSPAPVPTKKAEEGERRVRLSGLRKTIAQRLVEVKNTTAMLTTFNEVDMSQIIDIRSLEKEDFEKKYGVKL